MKSTLLVGAALLSALVFSPAQAREKVGNHTLGSAPDVWRVELRDLRTLKVLSSGDDDGVSELRSVTVRLSSPEGQSHHFVETSPYFRVARDGRYENATSRSRNNRVNVRVGDTLFLDNIIADRAERPADYSHYYNLWLHTRQRTSGDIERPQIQFDVAVETRELDCAGDRVCRRGSTGKSIYTVSLPIPETRSTTCTPENSFTVSGGDQLTIRPQAGDTSEAIQTVNARRSGSAQGRLIARGVTDAVHLDMVYAQLCIAATRRA